MGNRSILTGALALGLLMAAVPDGHADQTVPEGYVRVAMAHGVPRSALLGITERVFAQTSRGIRPWPGPSMWQAKGIAMRRACRPAGAAGLYEASPA